MGSCFHRLPEVSVEVKTLDGRQLEIRPQCEASYDSTPGFLLPVGLSGGFCTGIDQKESHVCLFSIKQNTAETSKKNLEWKNTMAGEIPPGAGFVCAGVKQGQGNVNGSTCLSQWPARLPCRSDANKQVTHYAF